MLLHKYDKRYNHIDLHKNHDAIMYCAYAYERYEIVMFLLLLFRKSNKYEPYENISSMFLDFRMNYMPKNIIKQFISFGCIVNKLLIHNYL